MPFHHPLQNLTIFQLFARLLGIQPAATSIKLHEAAKHGNEDLVRQAIDSCSELNESDDQGRSALQLAASSGCSQIFAMLIEAGATTHSPLIPPVSMADLCHVFALSMEQIFKVLLFSWLASKVRVPIPSFILRNLRIWMPTQLLAIPAFYCLSMVLVFRSYPETFLNKQNIITALTAFRGDTEYMLILFLESTPDLDTEEKKQLWCHAVERGYTGVCQRILRSGFPVDSAYIHCEWPDIVTGLLHACGASHRELVLLLLSNGADPTALDGHGRSCILMASSRPYTDYAGSIGESDAILACLLKTDALQHIDTIQKAADSDAAKLSLSGHHGWPVADACGDLRTSAVRMLLEAGANPNLKTESGWTALHVACRSHSINPVEIVRLLVQYGADVNAASDLNWTPLGCAASLGQFVDVVETLVEAGAQLESTAGDATALQIAARHDISGGKVMKYLARRGANVNATGGKFGSVLLATLQRPASFIPNDDGSIRSYMNPNPQIVEFISELLKHGLDLDLVPEGWKSPLEKAVQRNLPVVVSFLLEHGAKLPSNKGKGKAYRPNILNPSENSSPPRTSYQTSILSHVTPSQYEVIAILLDHEVPVDVDTIEFGGDSNMTILGTACSSSREDYLKSANILLERGADPNFRDMQGHFPIQRAAYAVSPSHLKKLVEYGASVQIENDEYGSLLHSLYKGYASQSSRKPKDFRSCFWFLQMRLSRDSVWKHDSAGRSCLHHLAELSQETRLIYKLDGTFSEDESSAVLILEEFLKVYGSSHPLERAPNPWIKAFQVQDLKGQSAFHIASQKGDIHFMRTLVAHITSLEEQKEELGISDEEIILALLTQPDDRGWNALHHAASEGRAFACMYILEASNARIATAVTCLGELAQDLANKNHHYGIAEYITNLANGMAGDHDALKKAERLLAAAVRKDVLLEFPEEQLVTEIKEQSRRLELAKESSMED